MVGGERLEQSRSVNAVSTRECLADILWRWCNGRYVYARHCVVCQKLNRLLIAKNAESTVVTPVAHHSVWGNSKWSSIRNIKNDISWFTPLWVSVHRFCYGVSSNTGNEWKCIDAVIGVAGVDFFRWRISSRGINFELFPWCITSPVNTFKYSHWNVNPISRSEVTPDTGLALCPSANPVSGKM